LVYVVQLYYNAWCENIKKIRIRRHSSVYMYSTHRGNLQAGCHFTRSKRTLVSFMPFDIFYAFTQVSNNLFPMCMLQAH